MSPISITTVSFQCSSNLSFEPVYGKSRCQKPSQSSQSMASRESLDKFTTRSSPSPPPPPFQSTFQASSLNPIHQTLPKECPQPLSRPQRPPRDPPLRRPQPPRPLPASTSLPLPLLRRSPPCRWLRHCHIHWFLFFQILAREERHLDAGAGMEGRSCGTRVANWVQNIGRNENVRVRDAAGGCLRV